MSLIDVTAAHLRELLDSGAENPVLYVNRETDGEPELAVWAGAYVDRDDVVITRDDLTDWLGDDWTEEDVAEYLPELQDTVDGIAPEPDTHFTAWLTTTTGELEGDDCDVTVLADEVNTWKNGAPDWTSTGDPIFHTLIGVPASDDDKDAAEERAEQLLAEAGWRTVGTWEGTGTGGIITVERADDSETWTLTEAAAHMGAANTNTAQRALKRLGVEAVGRGPGRGGESLFRPAEVMHAHATRPGQGARTDLQDR
jgi:hypothetical protein